MARLEGKRVLITGGAGGIGFCTAQEFAEAGCELILTDIDGEALEEAAGRLRARGARVHTYAYDVSWEQAVQDMAEAVTRDVGEVDVLINNAGIGHTGELEDTSKKTWKRLMDVNFWGPLHHVYAFLPRMRARRSGQIVNVSSGQSFFRLPTWGAYAAVKAALAVFSEVLHFEVRKYGIRVTTVYPFMVDTPFYEDIEGETAGTRLAMKLVPYYSMRPERVGRIVYKAVAKRHKVEMVTLINHLGHLAQVVPLASDVIARTTNFVLAKRTPAEERT